MAPPAQAWVGLLAFGVWCAVAALATSGTVPVAGQCGQPVASRANDWGAAFTVADSMGQNVGVLCPGKAYKLQVQFTEARKGSILTTNPGIVLGNGDAASACPNRYESNQLATTIFTSLLLPCNAAEPVVISVTSLDDVNQEQHARLILGVDTTCSVCRGGQHALAYGTSRRLLQAGSTTGAITPELLHAAPGCNQASGAYGYKCNRIMSNIEGWRLSYTISTSPVPPENACTNASLTAAQSLALPAGTNAWMHAMVAAQQQGWIALGWVRKAGKMLPSNTVLGGVYAGGAPYVNTYSFTDYALPAADDPSSSWGNNLGAVVTTDGRTALCFSRAVYLPGFAGNSSSSSINDTNAGRRLAQVNTILDLGQNLQMSFASTNSKDDPSHQHDYASGYELNMLTGASTTTASAMKKHVIAHGALMVTAFICLMPMAILLARHKHLLPHMVAGKAIWFWMHMALQFTAAVCFLAGMIVAWAQLGDGDVPSAGSALDAHSALGVIVLVGVGIQLVVAFIRPTPSHKWRWMWNLLHHNLGRTAVLLAWANVSIGIYLWSKLYSDATDWKSWTAAVVVIVCVMLLVEIVLEVAWRRGTPPAVPHQHSSAGNLMEVEASDAHGLHQNGHRASSNMVPRENPVW